MTNYGQCPRCGKWTFGAYATDGFHPEPHDCYIGDFDRNAAMNEESDDWTRGYNAAITEARVACYEVGLARVAVESGPVLAIARDCAEAVEALRSKGGGG